MVMGDSAVKFRVRSKADGFNWALVAVYGAAQPELKPEFLADLVRIFGSEQLPILVGGDFNIIKRREEKNASSTIYNKYNATRSLKKIRICN